MIVWWSYDVVFASLGVKVLNLSWFWLGKEMGICMQMMWLRSRLWTWTWRSLLTHKLQHLLQTYKGLTPQQSFATFEIQERNQKTYRIYRMHPQFSYQGQVHWNNTQEKVWLGPPWNPWDVSSLNRDHLGVQSKDLLRRSGHKCQHSHDVWLRLETHLVNLVPDAMTYSMHLYASWSLLLR